MFYNHLNNDSLRRINSIANGFSNHPAYAAYTIKSYPYDIRAGVHALEVARNGELMNLILPWYRRKDCFHRSLWQLSSRTSKGNTVFNDCVWDENIFC